MHLPESMAVTSASQPLLPARDIMGANTIDVHLGVTLLLEAATGPHTTPRTSLICLSVLCLANNLAHNLLFCYKIAKMVPKGNIRPALAPGDVLPR